jgi:hypothetical protein
LNDAVPGGSDINAVSSLSAYNRNISGALVYDAGSATPRISVKLAYVMVCGDAGVPVTSISLTMRIDDILFNPSDKLH